MTIDHRKPPPAMPPVLFAGAAIPEERDIKLLGVTFDTQLSFSTHLHSIATKAAQLLHFFAKVTLSHPKHQRSHHCVQGVCPPSHGVLLLGVDGLQYLPPGQDAAQGAKDHRPGSLASQPGAPQNGCIPVAPLQANLSASEKSP